MFAWAGLRCRATGHAAARAHHPMTFATIHGSFGKMGMTDATNTKRMISGMTAADFGQNDSRFGLSPPRLGGKSGFTGQPPPRPGKTTVVWGRRRLVRVIKALLPSRRRRVRAKRQSFGRAAAASGGKKRFCRGAAAAPG